MKDNIKRYIKNCFIILASYALTLVILTILLNLVFIPVCNTIWNVKEYGGMGAGIATVFTRYLLPILSFIPLYFFKLKDKNEYRIFKSYIREYGDFSIKQDFINLLKDCGIWVEIAFVTCASLIYYVINPVFFWVLLNIPVYLIFNFIITIRIHTIWKNN